MPQRATSREFGLGGQNEFFKESPRPESRTRIRRNRVRCSRRSLRRSRKRCIPLSDDTYRLVPAVASAERRGSAPPAEQEVLPLTDIAARPGTEDPRSDHSKKS